MFGGLRTVHWRAPKRALFRFRRPCAAFGAIVPLCCTAITGLRGLGRGNMPCGRLFRGATRTLTMAQTVGDFVVERLHAWGVRLIFGYPGDGINGVFGALHRAGKKIEFVQARHEEMAAFMACAYSKFTGE